MNRLLCVALAALCLCGVSFALRPSIARQGYCPRMKEIASGMAVYFPFCMLDEAGEAWCRAEGDNEYAIGGYEFTEIPTGHRTEEDGPVVDLCTTWYNACFLTESGAVFCTGSIDSGILGTSDVPRNLMDYGFEYDNYIAWPLPVRIAFDDGTFDSTKAVSIACAEETVYAVMDNGQVACWGYHSYNWAPLCGNFGNDYDGHSGDFYGEIYDPVEIDSSNAWSVDDAVVEVFAGYDSACFLTDKTELWCIGEDYFGNLGDPDVFYEENGFSGGVTSDPVLFGQVDCGYSGPSSYKDCDNEKGLSGIYAVGMGKYSTCVALFDETNGYQTFCAGENFYGELGRGFMFNNNDDAYDICEVSDWPCYDAVYDESEYFFEGNFFVRAKPVPALQDVVLKSISGGLNAFYFEYANGTLATTGAIYEGTMGAVTQEYLWEKFEYRIENELQIPSYNDGPWWLYYPAAIEYAYIGIAAPLHVLPGDLDFYPDIKISSPRALNFDGEMGGCLIGTTDGHQGLFCVGSFDDYLVSEYSSGEYTGYFEGSYELYEMPINCKQCPPGTVYASPTECVSLLKGECSVDSDCATDLTVCVEGVCECGSGYYPALDLFAGCIPLPTINYLGSSSERTVSTSSVDELADIELVGIESDEYYVKHIMTVTTNFECSYLDKHIEGLDAAVEEHLSEEIEAKLGNVIESIATEVTCDNKELTFTTDIYPIKDERPYSVALALKEEAYDSLISTAQSVTSISGATVEVLAIAAIEYYGHETVFRKARSYLEEKKLLPLAIVLSLGVFFLILLPIILCCCLRGKKKRADGKDVKA